MQKGKTSDPRSLSNFSEIQGYIYMNH